MSSTPSAVLAMKEEDSSANASISLLVDRLNNAQQLSQSQPRKPWMRKRLLFLLLFLAMVVIVVVLVVILPVYFVVIRGKSQHTSNASTATSSSNMPRPSQNGLPSPAPTIGGDGSRVVTDNGTEFTYHNPFGGYWVQDPMDPFNNGARPNEWTPPLNASWRWGKDRIYGVNLGGLFVLEPFIAPELFQRYPSAEDEWDISKAMRADSTNGGINQLEDHYKTFIDEQDIAEIAGAGLNFIRIPLAFWAIETWEGEPFLTRTSWKYFLQILDWARKYGLRVCLDLHAVPGSQNGYNHSGRVSALNFLSGNMGIANAERTLYYIRVLTEFISQPEYRDLIPIFGIVNEALVNTIGMDQMTSFYLRAHDMIRSITGVGEGNGPYIAIHDGFNSVSNWAGFLQGSDRIMMDQHKYFSFGGPQSDPLDVPGPDGSPGGQWPLLACNAWGPPSNQSRRDFGLTIVGEFAASPNDCGLFLRGAHGHPQTGDCDAFDNWEHYTREMKEGIKNFVMASMDAFGDWFFWTWKIGPAKSGRIETPLWSYQLGLRNGWIPSDPRKAVGKCRSLDASSSPFDGKYKPWQTGTPSSIPALSSSNFPWPPTSIVNAEVPVTLLPTYTNTAPVITLPVPTFTSAPAAVTQSVDGWFNDGDTTGGITTIAGCSYPNEYDGTFSVIPTAPCTGPTAA
ncbi:glycoside hydrolase family 5 protein [Amanita thiersii Skay4041]|uniref:glucan 1,3-beta-glucosidase n=1 Tax=Amanita thiersii Skay4041 TaxID=703135 RepID=A0A2A9N729_9AGAR|nr:glycoside hydrolase family 5 protein [Amanita thiersii Skay4041]